MNTCIVTALIDIGREKWPHLSRKFADYLKNFENVCKLDNNMVIWIEPENVDIVKKFRQGKEDKTVIYTTSINDLELYKYIDKITLIMKNMKTTHKFERHDAANAVEFTQPLYDILVNNKIKFIEKTKIMEPFGKMDYYTWIDAGYSHNSIDMTNKHVQINEKINVCIIKLWKWWFAQDILGFQYMWPLDVFGGGFVILDNDLVTEFSQKYYELIDDAINNINTIDDDQCFMTMMYVKYPNYFTDIKDGDWFEAAKYFIFDK